MFPQQKIGSKVRGFCTPLIQFNCNFDVRNRNLLNFEYFEGANANILDFSPNSLQFIWIHPCTARTPQKFTAMLSIMRGPMQVDWILAPSFCNLIGYTPAPHAAWCAQYTAGVCTSHRQEHIAPALVLLLACSQAHLHHDLHLRATSYFPFLLSHFIVRLLTFVSTICSEFRLTFGCCDLFVFTLRLILCILPLLICATAHQTLLVFSDLSIRNYVIGATR